MLKKWKKWKLVAIQYYHVYRVTSYFTSNRDGAYKLNRHYGKQGEARRRERQTSHLPDSGDYGGTMLTGDSVLLLRRPRRGRRACRNVGRGRERGVQHNHPRRGTHASSRLEPLTGGSETQPLFPHAHNRQLDRSYSPKMHCIHLDVLYAWEKPAGCGQYPTNSCR